MIRCQSCGNNNLDNSQYCDECGTKLRSEAITQSGTIDPPVHRTDNISPVTENVAVADKVGAVEPTGDPEELTRPRVREKNIAANGSGESGKLSAVLTIERGSSASTEFHIKGDESNIGRWDADNGVFPDVDLDSHDADAKVSRRHARIVRRGNSYFLEDQGSTNGTFVNRGRRLLPGVPHELKDGDEIIVGKTFLRFRITS